MQTLSNPPIPTFSSLPQDYFYQTINFQNSHNPATLIRNYNNSNNNDISQYSFSNRNLPTINQINESSTTPIVQPPSIKDHLDIHQFSLFQQSILSPSPSNNNNNSSTINQQQINNQNNLPASLILSPPLPSSSPSTAISSTPQQNQNIIYNNSAQSTNEIKEPLTYISENSSYINIEIELPGVSANNISITFKNSILIITATKNTSYLLFGESPTQRNSISNGIYKRILKINLDSLNRDSFNYKFIDGILFFRIIKPTLGPVNICD